MANETYHPRGELVDGWRPKDHPLYHVWCDMKSRCRNPKQVGYENYGARGILYCERWKHFANFAEDMYPSYKEGLTLERVDNALGYNANNCTWADRTQQCLNRRNFKNNSTDYPGVNKKANGSFFARYCAYDERFNLGRFNTAEEARDYRNRFIELLSSDRKAALKMTERRARRDGATGIRGITCHKGGSKFTVRITENGIRKYIGSSDTLAGAKKILDLYNVGS